MCWLSLSLWNSALGFEGKISLIWRHSVVLFSSRERRTGLSVSPEQTVWDGGHAVLLWNFEEGDWVSFRKPSGMCMGKPVWAAGISSKRRSTARVQRLHHGREEPVFVIRNAMEKSVHCSQLNTFFVLLVLWFTYKVFSSMTPSSWLPKMPTPVHDTTFYFHQAALQPNNFAVLRLLIVPKCNTNWHVWNIYKESNDTLFSFIKNYVLLSRKSPPRSLSHTWGREDSTNTSSCRGTSLLRCNDFTLMRVYTVYTVYTAFFPLSFPFDLSHVVCDL